MDFKFKVTSEKKVYYILKDNNISETIINRLRKDANLVLLNGKPSRVVDIAPLESEILIKVFDKNTNKIKKTYGKLDILYEDNYLLAVNKPPFVASIPNKYKTSITNDILGYLNINTYMPINRLDVNTSGILLIAKNPLVQHKLTNNFNKTYLAILTNSPKTKKLEINAKIGVNPSFKSLRKVDEINGKECLTKIKVVKKLKNNCSLCKINLVTGRTHQIRVHTSFIGSPLLGDTDYGALNTPLISRQALHAYKTEFIHPITNKKIKITCKLPQDFKCAIKALRY